MSSPRKQGPIVRVLRKMHKPDSMLLRPAPIVGDGGYGSLLSQGRLNASDARSPHQIRVFWMLA
jgi:hypothetical protein